MQPGKWALLPDWGPHSSFDCTVDDFRDALLRGPEGDRSAKGLGSGGVWIDRSALYHARQAYFGNRRPKNRRVQIEKPRPIDFTKSVAVAGLSTP